MRSAQVPCFDPVDNLYRCLASHAITMFATLYRVYPRNDSTVWYDDLNLVENEVAHESDDDKWLISTPLLLLSETSHLHSFIGIVLRLPVSPRGHFIVREKVIWFIAFLVRSRASWWLLRIILE